jgi:hypothetical protein
MMRKSDEGFADILGELDRETKLSETRTNLRKSAGKMKQNPKRKNVILCASCYKPLGRGRTYEPVYCGDCYRRMRERWPPFPDVMPWREPPLSIIRINPNDFHPTVRGADVSKRRTYSRTGYGSK